LALGSVASQIPAAVLAWYFGNCRYGRYVLKGLKSITQPCQKVKLAIMILVLILSAILGLGEVRLV